MVNLSFWFILHHPWSFPINIVQSFQKWINFVSFQMLKRCVKWISLSREGIGKSNLFLYLKAFFFLKSCMQYIELFCHEIVKFWTIWIYNGLDMGLINYKRIVQDRCAFFSEKLPEQKLANTAFLSRLHSRIRHITSFVLAMRSCLFGNTRNTKTNRYNFFTKLKVEIRTTRKQCKLGALNRLTKQKNFDKIRNDLAGNPI